MVWAVTATVIVTVAVTETALATETVIADVTETVIVTAGVIETAIVIATEVVTETEIAVICPELCPLHGMTADAVTPVAVKTKITENKLKRGCRKRVRQPLNCF